jgi:hypothetical protein
VPALKNGISDSGPLSREALIPRTAIPERARFSEVSWARAVLGSQVCPRRLSSSANQRERNRELEV